MSITAIYGGKIFVETIFWDTQELEEVAAEYGRDSAKDGRQAVARAGLSLIKEAKGLQWTVAPKEEEEDFGW